VEASLLNGLNPYRKLQQEATTPEDSVALVYDGARLLVDQALAALEAKNYEAMSLHTGKAQMVFSELTASLNFDAGEIAKNLSQLYEYWGWRLSQGLIHKDPAPFREVSQVLSEMRDAWADAARQMRMQRAVRVGG
jgi:flagellar protein FliS